MDEHPLLRALSSVDAAVDAAAGIDPASLPTRDKERALMALQRELSRLEGLRMRLLADAGDVADEHAARSAGVWLAVELRTGARQGARDQRLADTLARWSDVGTALRDGLVNAAQAEVIATALDALPDDLDPELVAKAGAQLVSDAGHFGPRELRVLARRVLDVVAPDLAEAHEERLLRAEERRGRAETRVTFRPRGDGVTDVIARVPDHVADRLRAYLDSFTAPRRGHLDRPAPGDMDLMTLPRRRGEAFRVAGAHPGRSAADPRRHRDLGRGDHRPRRDHARRGRRRAVDRRDDDGDRGTTPGLHREHPPGRARRGRRGSRPRPLKATVLSRAAQGVDDPRSMLPRRGL